MLIEFPRALKINRAYDHHKIDHWPLDIGKVVAPLAREFALNLLNPSLFSIRLKEFGVDIASKSRTRE